MKGDVQVTIYYGPLSWFKAQLPKGKNHKSLLEIVIERDEASRLHRHRMEGQEIPEPEAAKRPKYVVAESSDYASLNEHVITNFAGQVRAINPEHLYLHNPPVAVQTQMQRVFGLKKDDIKRYEYPVVTRKTLVEVHDGFASHLIGQESVKEQLLAALYPLTSAGRKKPVVLMFYGPSGVGKTETAQFVNGLLGEQNELMRKQFSMFQNDRFASYLFGGHHNEASFAHDLLDRESGVILIDEFDKANPIFHSAFYQLFDEGVFEDRNYRLEIGPALIICTSNYGSENQIRQTLGDALYSRFDALIRYEELKPAQIVQIIDKLFDRRLSQLDDEERGQLDEDVLRGGLHRLAANVGNVRKLGKQVDEVVSLQLVRSVLAEERSETA
ncbi:AAA family ATPase [uncultured Microbacterium sp.]|uniref:AAA family ATPase n=1 Tax=uncultured Microbacterium sp. TaxID=191216 RepID=UPI002621C730|nr:AAA family ATPase [uncultured Microbacterium sp.]